MPLKELIANTDKIIGKFPNTYTFTKNLCERLMRGRKGSVPLTIVRPSIINTSYCEPQPGWIDSFAAAAALFAFIGLGIVRHALLDLQKIGDVVPVDAVVATIIVAAATTFHEEKLTIIQVGTSDLNPLTWAEMKVDLLGYWNSTVSASKLGKAQIFTTTSPRRLKVEKLK